MSIPKGGFMELIITLPREIGEGLLRYGKAIHGHFDELTKVVNTIDGNWMGEEWTLFCRWTIRGSVTYINIQKSSYVPNLLNIIQIRGVGKVVSHYSLWFKIRYAPTLTDELSTPYHTWSRSELAPEELLEIFRSLEPYLEKISPEFDR